MRTRCKNKSQGYGQEFMKKIIICFIALFCITFAANAQQDVCKVTNGNGATVQVTVVKWDDSNIYITLGSDCADYVNVSLKFEYRASFNVIKGKPTALSTFVSQPFGETVRPKQSTNVTCAIRLPSKDAKIEKVTSVTITGARCE